MEKTVLQEIADLKKRTDEVERIVRIGTVTTVDAETGTARVSWDNGVRSGQLDILQNGTGWTPIIGQRVVSLHKPGDDGAGYILGAVI